MKLSKNDYRTLVEFRKLLIKHHCAMLWKRNFLKYQIADGKEGDITNEVIKKTNFEDIGVYILKKAKTKSCYVHDLSYHHCKVSPLEFFLGHSDLTFSWTSTKEGGVFWYKIFVEFDEIRRNFYK